ncbi:MAG: rhodanese-like domain-containing protein [Bacteroidales bacterium]|nr:rhodanese-like domain-containing protein [Bacteroidales bacterium]NTV18555.1 rhodanese-like domain-containing protein [Bacteroidales bacterium]
MKNIVTVQDGTEYIYPKDASPLLSSGEAVLLDIRTEYEFSYKRFEAKETVFIPFEEFTIELIEQYKGKLIIIADSFGLESKKLYPVLKENNFNALCLACGMHDWERDGMPIVVSKDFQLSGSCRCQLKPKRMAPKSK